jgi:hypothetical protein
MMATSDQVRATMPDEPWLIWLTKTRISEVWWNR